MCAGTLHDGLQRSLIQVFHDRRLQAGFVQLGHIVDLDVGQSLGAVNADKLGVFVDLAAGERTAARYAQGRHAAIAELAAPAEYLERNIFHRIGHFGEFQRYTHVRFIRTETAIPSA